MTAMLILMESIYDCNLGHVRTKYVCNPDKKGPNMNAMTVYLN